MNKLFTDLERRGIIENISSPKIKDLLDNQSISFYTGYDPTFKSLQIGNLFAITTMRRLQMAGHRPIIVMGGATGMIGDPSGKSNERNLLSDSEIRANLEGQRKQLESLLDFSDPKCGAIIVNNYDWFKDFNFITFLRDVGKSFRLGEMLAKDSVKSRIQSEVGISFTEFSYQILQAYDFYHLFRNMQVVLQLGGSDQWGNITAGIDLVRKLHHSAEAYGLVIPLVTDSAGKKFGKSEGGTVYLDPEITSPYKMYQYLLNAADSSVIQYLKYYTFLSLDEIENLARELESNPERREAQKILASKVTEYVHGSEGLKSALKATEIFFSGEVTNVSVSELSQIFEDVPAINISKSELFQFSENENQSKAISAAELIAKTPLYKSKGEVKRAILQKGIYINNIPITSDLQTISIEDFIEGKILIVRKGKKNYCLIKVI